MVPSMSDAPSLSTDQVLAFVQLARQGSLRAASESLMISEQGLRNRLLTLETRLGTQLYRKIRGVRRATPLTLEGQRFLPHALAFLERAGELCEMFSNESLPREVNVIGSQYLITYVLIEAVRRFHATFPQIRVRLSARTEREIEQTLINSPEFSLGFAAPYESSPDLQFQHLFSMNWSLITPQNHKLLKNKNVKLSQLVDQPLILYEPGSTGRQHVSEAFQHQALAPHVEMEATTTDLIVRMVESGLGIGIVPLLPSGVVTRGRRVGIRPLGKQIRPIESGVLTRKGEPSSEASRKFVEFVRRSLSA